MNYENENEKNIIIDGINCYNIPINNYETLKDIRIKLNIDFTKNFLEKNGQQININEEENKLAIDCLKNNILELKSDLKNSILFFNNNNDDYDYENQNNQKKQIKNKNYILINKSNNERLKIYSINENEKISEIRKKGKLEKNDFFLDKNDDKIFIGSEENVTIENISRKIKDENVIYYYSIEKYNIYFNKSKYNEIDNSIDINKTNLSELREKIKLYYKARFIRVNNKNKYVSLDEEKFTPIAEVLENNCINAELIEENNLKNNDLNNHLNNNDYNNNNYYKENIINDENFHNFKNNNNIDNNNDDIKNTNKNNNEININNNYNKDNYVRYNNENHINNNYNINNNNKNINNDNNFNIHNITLSNKCENDCDNNINNKFYKTYDNFKNNIDYNNANINENYFRFKNNNNNNNFNFNIEDKVNYNYNKSNNNHNYNFINTTNNNSNSSLKTKKLIFSHYNNIQNQIIKNEKIKNQTLEEKPNYIIKNSYNILLLSIENTNNKFLFIKSLKNNLKLIKKNSDGICNINSYEFEGEDIKIYIYDYPILKNYDNKNHKIKINYLQKILKNNFQKINCICIFGDINNLFIFKNKEFKVVIELLIKNFGENINENLIGLNIKESIIYNLEKFYKQIKIINLNNQNFYMNFINIMKKLNHKFFIENKKLFNNDDNKFNNNINNNNNNNSSHQNKNIIKNNFNINNFNNKNIKINHKKYFSNFQYK